MTTKVKTRRGRLSDAEVVQHSRKAKVLEARIKRLETMRERHLTAVLKEFDRRKKTKVIEHDGVKVTRVAGSHTNYNFPLLMTRLGAKKAREYQKQVVDTTAVGRAVQEGVFPTELLDEITTVVSNKPYLSISFTP